MKFVGNHQFRKKVSKKPISVRKRRICEILPFYAYSTAILQPFPNIQNHVFIKHIEKINIFVGKKILLFLSVLF